MHLDETHSEVESTDQPQSVDKVMVYPGADAEFLLYQDDGVTYAYEKGEGRITNLSWNDAAQKLSWHGAAAWERNDSEIIQIAGH